MQKSFQTLLWCISFVLVVFTSGFAQDSKSGDGNNFSTSGKFDSKTTGQIPFTTEGIVTITHSTSQTIVTGNSVSCNAGGLHTNNSYWRAFNLPSFGISGPYTVTDVSIGVEQATSTSASQQVTCNLYTSSQVFPAGFPGSLTLIGTSTVDVTPQTLTILNIPVSGLAPAGSELVVEIFTPDGQTLGNGFFIGSNSLGETGPSYISATDCGISAPTATSAIGFPQMQIVMNVTGNDGAPCPVGPATNPSPVSGATNVSINPGNATWTNGVGTTQVEVFFGPAGNSVSVYSGTPIESIAIPGPLAYATDYEWKVVCKNDTCSGAPVATWTFTTEQDPNLATLFFDDFEAGSGLWTILNNGGTCVWTVYTPPFPNLYTLPCDPNCGSLLSADSDECGSGTTINSSAVIASPLDISLYSQVDLEFDQDFNDFGGPDEGYVEVSNDGGTTWNIVWQQVGADLRNTHEVVDISTFAALQSSVLIRFRSVQPSWDWWWTIDNVKVTGSGLVPVELVSFAATTNNSDVTLNWSTATELNNSGFQIERSNGSAYEVVGFVAGHGTTTEVRNYNFVDQNVASGTYSYRLKQVDFDGTFEYSNAIEVEVLGVKEFALGQNYPNPFNPSTTINFSLAVDSKVSLKIFDVLGQEVATLLNGQMAAGNQKVSFDASSLNSGVYFYRIDASGVDGQKFSSTKKMILTK